MAKQLFGTDGIRGIPGQYPLDDATLDRIGYALGMHVQSSDAGREPKRPRVLIGRDTRESGLHIAERIARGLVAAGAEPVSAGVLPTPGVAWLVNREGFRGGRDDLSFAQSVSRQWREADFVHRNEISGCGRGQARGLHTFGKGICTCGVCDAFKRR